MKSFNIVEQIIKLSETNKISATKSNIFFSDKSQSGLGLLGCDICVGKKAHYKDGEAFIDDLPLVKNKENIDMPNFILENLWMCPKCNRPFEELIPEPE